MHNGNLADAQLRALIDVAAAAAGAHRLEEVLELAAERALEAVGAASLSISRWDMRRGILRTLDQRRRPRARGRSASPPTRSTRWRTIRASSRLMGEDEFAVGAIDDPGTDAGAARAARGSSARRRASPCQMILDGKAWGELEVLTAPGEPRAVREGRGLPAGDRGSGRRARSTAPSCSRRSRRSPTPTRSPASRAGAPSSGRSRRRAPSPARPGQARARALRHRQPEAGQRRRRPRGRRPRAVRRGRRAGRRASARHPDAVVGRFGGDEFCVLLPSGTAEDARGGRARRGARASRRVGGERISCGVAARDRRARRPGRPAARRRRGPVPGEARATTQDVLAASDSREEMAEPQGRDRAYRASDPEARART